VAVGKIRAGTASPSGQVGPFDADQHSAMLARALEWLTAPVLEVIVEEVKPLGKWTLWTGLDSVPEVVAATSGAELVGAHAYELLTGGSHAARSLLEVDLGEERPSDLGRDGGASLAPWLASCSSGELEPTWAATYRRVGETGSAVTTPFAIYLVGVNPPRGAGPTEMEEFNDFYTNVHMPEVAARRRCLRATRYELDRQLFPAASSCPQFLAAYELNERAAATKRHIGGAYAPGPEVWRKHTTPWRLWYRRLPDALDEESDPR
jgi:hypothetical protein